MKFRVQSHSYLILINRLTPPHPPHPHLTCSSMRFSSCSAMLIFILTSSPSLLICVCCKTSTFSFNFLISLIRFFSKGEWYFLLFLLLLCLRIVDRFSASDCFGGAEIQLKVFFLNLITVEVDQDKIPKNPLTKIRCILWFLLCIDC